MNIALCGMMGCGKSTVAAVIAEKYGYKLVDTDAEIEKIYGPINDIFARYGEGYFRKIEGQTIKDCLSHGDKLIISLGGGAVLSEENVAAIKNAAKLVYLRTEAENLIKRLKNSTNRPLLNGTMRDRVVQILAQREPVYEGVADKIVDTDGLDASLTAQKVMETVL